MPTYVYQSCLFVRRQIEKSLTLRESFLAERAKFLINTHYETNQLNSEIYNGMHSDEIRKVWNGKQLGFWRSLVAQAVRTFSPEKQQTILTKLDHLQKNGVSHAGTLFPGGFWDSFTDAKKKKLFEDAPEFVPSLPRRHWAERGARLDLIEQAEKLTRSQGGIPAHPCPPMVLLRGEVVFSDFCISAALLAFTVGVDVFFCWSVRCLVFIFQVVPSASVKGVVDISDASSMNRWIYFGGLLDDETYVRWFLTAFIWYWFYLEPLVMFLGGHILALKSPLKLDIFADEEKHGEGRRCSGSQHPFNADEIPRVYVIGGRSSRFVRSMFIFTVTVTQR